MPWETLLDHEAPAFVLSPAPDEEAEAFDWDLSTVASNAPVEYEYEYVPNGAPDLGMQHSTASSSSASSRDVSPVKAVEVRGSRFGQQHDGAVSRLSSVAAALDESSVDDLQHEINQLQLAEPMSSEADGARAMGNLPEEE